MASILPVMAVKSNNNNNTCDKAEKGLAGKESSPLPPKSLQDSETEAWITTARHTSLVIAICLGLLGAVVVTLCSHAMAGKPTTMSLKVMLAATCVVAGQVVLIACTATCELRHFAKKFTVASIGIAFVTYCAVFVVHYEVKALPWLAKQSANSQFMVLLQYNLLLLVPFVAVIVVVAIMMPSEHGTAAAEALIKAEQSGTHWLLGVAIFVIGCCALMGITLVLTPVDIIRLLIASIAILCYTMLIMAFALVSSSGGPTNPLPFFVMDQANVLSVVGPSVVLLLIVYA